MSQQNTQQVPSPALESLAPSAILAEGYHIVHPYLPGLFIRGDGETTLVVADEEHIDVLSTLSRLGFIRKVGKRALRYRSVACALHALDRHYYGHKASTELHRAALRDTQQEENA